MKSTPRSQRPRWECRPCLPQVSYPSDSPVGIPSETLGTSGKWFLRALRVLRGSHSKISPAGSATPW